MDDRNMKEVRFDQYCKSCKYEELDEKFDPCNECLEYGYLENTRKPCKYEEKE